MSYTQTSEEAIHNRRRFSATAAMTLAAAEFATIGPAPGQSVSPAKVPAIKPGIRQRNECGASACGGQMISGSFL
jgi:hypothetical protein